MTQQDLSQLQECTQETNGKLYCWCCMKQVGTNPGGDRYFLASCCSNSYTQESTSYPQDVETLRHAQRKDEEIKALTSTFTQTEDKDA